MAHISFAIPMLAVVALAVADAEDAAAAFANLPGRALAQVPAVAAPKLFSGEFHRSAYHTDAARRARKQRYRDVESDLTGLSSAWNANVLRSGDRTFAGEPSA